MKVTKSFALLFSAAVLLLPVMFTHASQDQPAMEAPTGFDNQTNGFVAQSQFEADQAAFNQHEAISDGLGPVYNAQGCGECHQNPIAGGASQIAEVRAGH